MNEHPQRTGRSLFLLWAAGLIAQAVLMRIAVVITSPGMGGLNVHGSIVFVAVAIVSHAWQAWLLFRPGWRFGLWTALPLLGLVMPGNIRWIQMLGIIAPCLETVALANVRLRPWAWLLAGMGQVILSQLGAPLINNLASGVVNQLGLSIFVSSLIVSGALTGLWLVGELAAAYVLAWWMPPITPESHTSPPPPPGSTGA